MAALSGVGSGAAAASGSAKTTPAASTVDALSISRLESLLARMSGPAACGLDATAHLTAFTAGPRARVNAEKDTTLITTLQSCCHPIARLPRHARLVQCPARGETVPTSRAPWTGGATPDHRFGPEEIEISQPSRLLTGPSGVNGEHVLGFAHAPQRVPTDRQQLIAHSLRGLRERVGDQDWLAQRFAQSLQARRLIHGGADDGEVEAVRSPYVAVGYFAGV